MLNSLLKIKKRCRAEPSEVLTEAIQSRVIQCTRFSTQIGNDKLHGKGLLSSRRKSALIPQCKENDNQKMSELHKTGNDGTCSCRDVRKFRRQLKLAGFK